MSLADALKGYPSLQTGSSLVAGVEPKDIDYVILMADRKDAHEVWKWCPSHRDCSEAYEGSDFLSLRDGNTNYILVWDREVFTRWALYTEALQALQLKDKTQRVALAQAIRGSGAIGVPFGGLS